MNTAGPVYICLAISHIPVNFLDIHIRDRSSAQSPSVLDVTMFLSSTPTTPESKLESLDEDDVDTVDSRQTVTYPPPTP